MNYDEMKARQEKERTAVAVEFSQRLVDVNLHRVMGHHGNSHANTNADGMIAIFPEASHHSARRALHRVEESKAYTDSKGKGLSEMCNTRRAYVVTCVGEEIWIADFEVNRVNEASESVIVLDKEDTTEDWFATFIDEGETPSSPRVFSLGGDKKTEFTLVFSKKV